ncbi:hypothetical protein F5I97DRAFT_1939597 [Phlebopus sp. FC_14]|nr:hypothetical protein F5I97DRAFT_1939597 [Phlebopus sp. FC_14]
MWITKDSDEAWLAFKSHPNACAFLSLSFPSISLLPALETDLQPLDNLRRVPFSYPSAPLQLNEDHFQHQLRMSLSTPDLHKRAHAAQPTFIDNLPLPQNDDFVISSNPPNPRTTFRLGDWICTSPSCAAHNFGRNLACRGCGCPRSEGQVSSANRQGSLGMPPARLPASPRFVGAANSVPFSLSSIPTSPIYPNIPRSVQPSAPQQSVAKPPSPSHPLLTPSGRSFAVGGKVQNVSSDPSCPCVMYWPDNEPFPEQGQIRPSSLLGVPQPPILNTGNRGPIEHQPGDWICLKCNYLNWRRRKVCQTCFPYAEGNGDSISAAVQAERINLLTSLLAQNQLPLNYNPVSAPDPPRPQTMSPSQHRRLMGDATPLTQTAARSRSRSQHEPGVQYPDTQFIYETSGPRRSSSSFSSMRELEESLLPVPPAPLLPSFLQDIVQSPTLSPTSTSSADLSIEEYDDNASSPGRPSVVRDRLVASNDSSSHLPLGNIWRLNDEETKGIAGIALPHHEELLVGRKTSDEALRRRGSP